VNWGGDEVRVVIQLDPGLNEILRELIKLKLNPDEKWENRLKAAEGRIARLRSDLDSLEEE